jgi:NAD(P)-dependent dehydrogenase (short-subunit alcohol dehydrogenase family)
MESRKIILVTGGSRGLGKDMAINIAKKGMDVIITYRGNKEGADDTIRQVKELGSKAIALSLDMSQLSSLDAFVSEVSNVVEKEWNGSKLFGLVNNAGIGGNFPFGNVTEQVFDEFLNIHFKGVYFLTQKLLPLIEDGGRIVNISTGTTRFVNPGYSVYASMKGAIEVFTKYLAKELGPKGIRANVIAPGPN